MHQSVFKQNKSTIYKIYLKYQVVSKVDFLNCANMLRFCRVKTIRPTVKNIAQRENIFDVIVERASRPGIESMTYVQSKGLSGEPQIYCAETRIPRIFSATATHAIRRNARASDPLKNHRWFIHASYRRACRRASFRKLGGQPSSEL